VAPPQSRIRRRGGCQRYPSCKGETPSNHSRAGCTERSLPLYSCSPSFLCPNSSSARAVAVLLFTRMPYVPLRHTVTEYPVNRVAGGRVHRSPDGRQTPCIGLLIVLLASDSTCPVCFEISRWTFVSKLRAAAGQGYGLNPTMLMISCVSTASPFGHATCEKVHLCI
jgi:hypothetical protein